MKYIKAILLFLTMGVASGEGYDSDETPISELFSEKHRSADNSSNESTWYSPPSYNASPLNYENSELNYENSPLNYKNSHLNYENSPLRYGNKRIVRDNRGNPIGYEVPKSGGGANYFDFQGNRLGYRPNNE